MFANFRTLLKQMICKISYLIFLKREYSSVSLSFIGTSSRYGGRMVKLQRSLWAGGRASPRAPAGGTGPHRCLSGSQCSRLNILSAVAVHSTCCCLSCFVEENLNLSSAGRQSVVSLSTAQLSTLNLPGRPTLRQN